MHIGIVGPINPYELRNYLSTKNVLNVNKSATSVTTYVKELCRSTHEVSIFSFYPDNVVGVVEYHGQNIHIYMISPKHSMHIYGYPYRILALRRVIKQHIKELNVLHAQWTYEYAFTAQMFSNIVPVFCSVRDWCPYIQTTMTEFKYKLDWWIKRLLFERVMDNKRITFIANSDYTIDCIKKRSPNNSVRFIANPIYKDFIINDRDSYPNHPIFLSIAQAVSDNNKNNITTVKAFHKFLDKYPNAELWFVGQTENDGNVETYVCQNEIKHVKFIGTVSHDDLFTYIDGATCLVHASKKETFGNILLEAMARRIPCIGGKDSGGVPQVLDNGDCGILCDIYSVESVLDAMIKSLNTELTTPIIEKATKKLLSQYASDTHMKRTIEIYNSVNCDV